MGHVILRVANVVPRYFLWPRVGSPILVIGIFWLGWTGQYASIPWYVPALSTIFLGIGISSIFISFLVGWKLIDILMFAYFFLHLQSYLVDTYL